VDIKERSAEAAEAQIDAFIERRSRKGETDPDEREDLWVESVRRFNEQQRRQIRAEWYGWHCDQAERHRRTLESLIAHHEQQAERLLEDEPDEPSEAKETA
jgi:hypothetical protein